MNKEIKYDFYDFIKNKEKVVNEINEIIKEYNNIHNALFKGYKMIGEKLYEHIYDIIISKNYYVKRLLASVMNSNITLVHSTRSSGTKKCKGYILYVRSKINTRKCLIVIRFKEEYQYNRGIDPVFKLEYPLSIRTIKKCENDSIFLYNLLRAYHLINKSMPYKVNKLSKKCYMLYNKFERLYVYTKTRYKLSVVFFNKKTNTIIKPCRGSEFKFIKCKVSFRKIEDLISWLIEHDKKEFVNLIS